MSFWIILSWILVVALTAVNVFIFMKLKSASEQMLQMAFPGANMADAMKKMQQMTGQMGGMGNMGAMAARGSRGPGKPGMPAGSDAQLKAAMQMLQNMQQKGGKR